MRSPNTHKCRSYIRSAKTSACPCISLAVTPVTGYVLQPSESDPSHQSHYYRSCCHKSNSLCDRSHDWSCNQGFTTKFCEFLNFPSVCTIEISGHVTRNFRQRFLTIILTISSCTVLEMLPGNSSHMINHPN